MTEASAEERGLSLDSLCTEINVRRHLVVATNRGPVSFKSASDGSPSPLATGGLAAAALTPLADRMPLTWISAATGEADIAAVRSASDGAYSGQPLPERWAARFASVPRRVSHKHYNLVCNPLLWFLHHRTWGPSHTPNIDATLVDAWNTGHVAVADAYRVEIEQEFRRVGRPLLLNTRDFTLPLLPGLVRASLPDTIILHSSDVPWPGPDWWMLLPRLWRQAIFRSLLTCDVISFASARDRRGFIASASEFVHGISAPGEDRLEVGGRQTRLIVSPGGIDPAGLTAMSRAGRARAEAERMAAGGGDLHTFVTVERAEPHKNIVRSIRAFGRFLELSPGAVGQVRFLLVLAPPAGHLGLHRRYVDEIRSAANDIAKRHDHRGWRPIELEIERNYPRALAALTLYDTLISVPLADGSGGSAVDGAVVNERRGDLIVSDTSPAAELFANQATIVSPTDIEGLALAMKESFERPGHQRTDRAEKVRAIAMGQARERALEVELARVVQVG